MLGSPLGSADDEPDGSGSSVISVGVGTGGWSSGGNGTVELDGTDTGGITDGDAPADGGAVEAGTEAIVEGAVTDGPAGRAVKRTEVSGSPSPAPCSGAAAPIPPLPPFGMAVIGCRAGSARFQPTATAIGSPNATSPKKMDLGDSCTKRQLVQRRRRLRPTSQNGVDR